MLKHLIYCALLLLLFGNCKPSEAPSPEVASDLAAFADSIFQINVDQEQIAGASVVIGRGDEILLDTAYGFASLELEVPMPMHASFEIGSVTKQFTAAAILKLEAMGKLSLDDDFTDYLEFDTGGRSIPIRRLLDHTSGIPSYTEIEAFWPFSFHTYKRDSLLRMVEQHDFLFEPGRALIYNNTAYFILGLIIESVSGQSYEAFLEEQIFDPLGMDNTYYCSNTKVVKNKVSGYGYSKDGLQQKGYLDHTWPYAAGSLCSTTADLLKWLKGLHQDNFLGDEIYQQLITPEPLADGTPVKYAKGVSASDYHGHPMISHGGGINGFLSETRYFPDEDLYFICLVNTTGPKGAGYFADELTWYLMDKKGPQKMAPDLDLASLAGRYSGQARGRRLTVDVNAIENALTFQTEGADQADTLDYYIGNRTWLDDGQILTFGDDELRVDMTYNYIILQKE